MAEDADPILIFEIDEESGDVVYSRPRLSQTKYMLGPKDAVMEIMADFLAQQDFGEKA